jgi:hypothetical protein
MKFWNKETQADLRIQIAKKKAQLKALWEVMDRAQHVHNRWLDDAVALSGEIAALEERLIILIEITIKVRKECTEDVKQ